MAKTKKPEKQAGEVVRKRPQLAVTVSAEVKAEAERRAKRSKRPLGHVVDEGLRIGFGMTTAETEPPTVEPPRAAPTNGKPRGVDVLFKTPEVSSSGGVACVLCGAPVPTYPIQRACPKARSSGWACGRYWPWSRPERRDCIEVTKLADTMGGSACLAGTRMPVSTVVGLHENGGCEAVKDTYPHLTQDQIDAALAYAEAYPEEIAAELGHWPKHVDPSRKPSLAVAVATVRAQIESERRSSASTGPTLSEADALELGAIADGTHPVSREPLIVQGPHLLKRLHDAGVLKTGAELAEEQGAERVGAVLDGESEHPTSLLDEAEQLAAAQRTSNPGYLATALAEPDEPAPPELVYEYDVDPRRGGEPPPEPRPEQRRRRGRR